MQMPAHAARDLVPYASAEVLAHRCCVQCRAWDRPLAPRVLVPRGAAVRIWEQAYWRPTSIRPCETALHVAARARPWLPRDVRAERQMFLPPRSHHAQACVAANRMSRRYLRVWRVVSESGGSWNAAWQRLSGWIARQFTPYGTRTAARTDVNCKTGFPLTTGE